MKIMILVGSADQDSHSLHLGQAIEKGLQDKNADITLINLVESGLPLYNRSIEREDKFSEATRSFLKESLEMDAFVWVTPIYHNSYSSTLKNALDWHHTTKFPGRVVGLASNGGNRSPQAADQLILVARSQGMITIPTRVCTDEIDYDDALNISDEGIKQRIERFCDELVSTSQKLKSDK